MIILKLLILVIKTEPIIKHYEKQGVLKHVDGIGTIEEVFQRIDKIIGDEN